MNLKVWCQTDVGLKRERNEDSFIFDEGAGIYVVADGMGGHRGGEIASKMAVEVIRDTVSRGIKESGARRVHPRALLVSACERASAEIFGRSQEGMGELQGMGTTVVAALEHRETLYIASVGDSRAYLFANNRLWQLTEDHSWVNEQLRAGLLSEEELRRTKGKNVITRCVGYEAEVQVDVIERSMSPGDLYLLCTDGLTGLVTDERISSICEQHAFSDVVSICVEEAKQNGGDDNVTVMALYAEPRSN